MRKINECFRHLVSSSGKRRKTDNNKKTKEAEKRTDEKEATKLDPRISRMNLFFFLFLFTVVYTLYGCYIKKIRHGMLCVTGVYNTTNTIYFQFCTWM